MNGLVAQVRPYVNADARFVRDLSVEVFTEYGGRDAAARTVALAYEPNARSLVAECGGRHAGFVIVSTRGADAHLNAIAVARRFRARGVGQELLRLAEDSALVRGATRMQLETGEANLEAIALFVRAGYRQVGRIARYYRTGYDALVLRKVLVASSSNLR